MLRRLLGRKDFAAEGKQVDRCEIKGNIAQRSPDILVGNIELRGDILRKLANIQILVDHKDADHRGRQEIGHIVVDACQLAHL